MNPVTSSEVLLLLFFLFANGVVLYIVYRVLYHFCYKYEVRKLERLQAIQEAEKILKDIVQ